jgi:hypothetical protein
MSTQLFPRTFLPHTSTSQADTCRQKNISIPFTALAVAAVLDELLGYAVADASPRAVYARAAAVDDARGELELGS